MALAPLLELIAKGKLYDLGQPYFVGMPHHPAHPPFLFGLSKKHGDIVIQGGASSAAEVLTLGGHVGTHIDGLAHFSRDGKLHGGVEADSVQSYGGGFRKLSIDTVAPILRRGVLADVAGLVGVDELPPDFTVTPEHLEAACRAPVSAGDVVLLRTGWARYWEDPQRYLGRGAGPGPQEEGGRWLSARGVFAVGSDTIAFERVPSPSMPVHVHLLVENGIHILEALNLEVMARDGVREFLFLAAPLKIRGGTGSPIRPFALAW